MAGHAKSARAPTRRRRRGGPARGRGAARGRGKGKAVDPATSSDEESDADAKDHDDDEEIVNAPAEADQEGVSAMEREIRELEDEDVRRTNAYTGATNSIGSVHQRRWYLSLDRVACGFVKRRKAGKVVWEPDDPNNAAKVGESSDGRLTFPFYVRGAEAERSVVTGRLGADVLRDEGVEGYVGRKGWRPVLN